MSMIFSWGEIDKHQQGIATKILDMICNEEYNRVNQKYLKKWYREKIRGPVSTYEPGNGWTLKTILDSSTWTEIRKELTHNIETLEEILAEFPFYDDVIKKETWEKYSTSTLERKRSPKRIKV